MVKVSDEGGSILQAGRRPAIAGLVTSPGVTHEAADPDRPP